MGLSMKSTVSAGRRRTSRSLPFRSRSFAAYLAQSRAQNEDAAIRGEMCYCRGVTPEVELPEFFWVRFAARPH